MNKFHGTLLFALFGRMLEEFEREVEHTDSRLRSLTSRVNKAIRKSGGECIVVSHLYCITPSQIKFMHVCGLQSTCMQPRSKLWLSFFCGLPD